MKNKGMIIYIGLVLLFTNFMSYVGGGEGLSKLLLQVSRMVLLILIPIVLIYRNKYPKTTLFKGCMRLMCFFLFSMIGAIVIHNQSITDSFIVTSYAFVYLMFPIMYMLKLDEKSLIKLCFVLGFFWAAIMLIQQFTWPSYWFATRGETEEGEPEMRNGIIRYGVAGTTFGLLMLFYAFQKYLEEGKRKYLVWIIIGLIGVYLTCTRQIMAASAGCLLVGLWLKKKLRLGTLLGILLIGLVIYINADALFGEYVEMTETVDEDYIRFIALRYYALEYNKGNVLLFFLGNGEFRANSAYGREMMIGNWEERGVYWSDVGWVGVYSAYGIITVLIILYIYYYIFKNRKYIDLYLLLFMLYSFVTSIMMNSFPCKLSAIGTILVLYLIDLSMVKNKKAEYLKRQKAYEIQHNSAGI